MKTRWSAIFEHQPHPIARTSLIIFAALLLLVLPAEETMAQGPFQRLRRGFDAIRPGWIIPHASEPAASNKDDSPKKTESGTKSQKPKKKTKTDDSGKTPELAKPIADESTQPSEDALANDNESAMLEMIAKDAPDDFGATAVSEKDGSVTLAKIDADGAARAADLRMGDAIRTVGGIAITSAESLQGITDDLNGGVVLEFEIVRDGEELKKDVQFGKFQVVELPTDSTTSQGTTPAAKPLTPAVPSPVTDSPTLAPSTPEATDLPNFRSVLAPTPADHASPTSAVPPPTAKPLLLDLSTPVSKESTSVPHENAIPELDNSLDMLLDLGADGAR